MRAASLALLVVAACGTEVAGYTPPAQTPPTLVLEGASRASRFENVTLHLGFSSARSTADVTLDEATSEGTCTAAFGTGFLVAVIASDAGTCLVHVVATVGGVRVVAKTAVVFEDVDALVPATDGWLRCGSEPKLELGDAVFCPRANDTTDLFRPLLSPDPHTLPGTVLGRWDLEHAVLCGKGGCSLVTAEGVVTAHVPAPEAVGGSWQLGDDSGRYLAYLEGKPTLRVSTWRLAEDGSFAPDIDAEIAIGSGVIDNTVVWQHSLVIADPRGLSLFDLVTGAALAFVPGRGLSVVGTAGRALVVGGSVLRVVSDLAQLRDDSVNILSTKPSVGEDLVGLTPGIAEVVVARVSTLSSFAQETNVTLYDVSGAAPTLVARGIVPDVVFKLAPSGGNVAVPNGRPADLLLRTRR